MEETDADLIAACDIAEMAHKRQKTSGLGISGFQIEHDFLTEEEETVLLQQIDKAPWNTSLARRTQHYGYEYDYTSKTALKKAAPFPDWCDPIVGRLLERGLLKVRPDQLIINEYKPGQGIAPHIDNPRSFADGIASVSLEGDIVMDFSCGETKKELLLPRRSVFALHGDARYKWCHGIVRRKTDNGIPRKKRVSLTFRNIIIKK